MRGPCPSVGSSRCAHCLDASHAETVFHPHTAALKGTHQHVLQLKNLPPGTPQRASSMPRRGISFNWNLCFHFMGLSAHIQSHPHAAALKGTHQRGLQWSSRRNACPIVRAPRTSVGSNMLLYKTEKQIFFVSNIQFLIPDAVANSRVSFHIQEQQKLFVPKNMHPHLPNIHASLTKLHHSLINFHS